MITKAILIGSGNVAWHFAKMLPLNGIEIEQVFSRNEKAGIEISEYASCKFTSDIERIEDINGVYFILVNDKSIIEVAQKIYKKGRVLVHCSGGIKMQDIQFGNATCGVFYPIQTFNKGIEINWTNTIFCIDANEEKLKLDLFALAKKISLHTYFVNNEQRLIFNLSAVFVNNFTNYLFTIADDILQKHEMGINMLMPIIETTIEKIKTHPPYETQTGPAKRGELKVIEKHLDLLNEYPQYKIIYQLLSESILNKYQRS